MGTSIKAGRDDRTTRQNRTARQHELGRRGEDVAVEYLRSKKLTIIHRNWRCREGELDIIATDGIRLIVCEVKTRTSNRLGAPIESIVMKKAQRIRWLTQIWLDEYRVPFGEIRFDLIGVLWPPGGPPMIDHVQEAF